MNEVRYLRGNEIDHVKWDRCMDGAVNGNICGYSWFLDILCNEWDGLVADDYTHVMPVPVASRLGVRYLFQPRFIQQLGVFGNQIPTTETLRLFIETLPSNIRVVDYHFNYLNNMPTGWDVELLTDLLLKLDKPYEELRLAYSQNLLRNLKKSTGSGFYLVKNDNPEPVIQLFRSESGRKFSVLKNTNYFQLTRVINGCLNRDKAKVWSVYNRQNELCAGAIWLFSHERAVFYFSGQNKTGRTEGALSWLIDTFIRENASSGLILDFEGSVQPGLARFYRGFGAVQQTYPRLMINRLSPLLKVVYRFYRKLKKG